jgi:hypothetical protein
MRVYQEEEGEQEVEVKVERGEGGSWFLLFTPPSSGMAHLSVTIGTLHMYGKNLERTKGKGRQ